PTLIGAPNMPAQMLAIPYAPSSASASVGFDRLWRPLKCSTTREVIRMLTLETKANANAEGSTVNTSCGLHAKPANGGMVHDIAPISRSWKPRKRAAKTASATPTSGAGTRGDQ